MFAMSIPSSFPGGYSVSEDRNDYLISILSFGAWPVSQSGPTPDKLSYRKSWYWNQDVR
jgi:hypothetical protein